MTADLSPRVTTIEVRREVIERTLAVTGSLVARRELPVGTEVTGLRVEAVLAEEGDWVRHGDVLVRLNTGVLSAQLARTEAALREAEVTQVEAEASLRRTGVLRGAGGVSAEELEGRQAAARKAEARVALARAERAELQTRLAQAEVRAPAAGRIARRTAQVGMVVDAAGAGEPLFRLIEDGRVEFDAQIAEADLPVVAVGQVVNVRLAGFGNSAATSPATFPGRVRALAPSVDPQTRLGTVHVELPADERLRPGAFARGEILTGQRPILALPQSALIFGAGGEAHVCVIGANGRVEQRPVQVGLVHHGRVEARAGLAEGELVARAAGVFLRDGSTVTVARAGDKTGAGKDEHSQTR